jgi:uncharacterized DUF497 family protein
MVQDTLFAEELDFVRSKEEKRRIIVFASSALNLYFFHLKRNKNGLSIYSKRTRTSKEFRTK